MFTIENGLTEVKELKPQYLEYTKERQDVNYVSEILSDSKQHPVQQLAWPEYPYKPRVTFAMAYNEQNIFLKFFVCEEFIRAVNFDINSNVYEDTCVEFFMAFDNDENYYNLEFNCYGTCLAGFGKGKTGRTLLPPERIEKIQTLPYLISSNSSGEHEVYWELTLIIPASVFYAHNISSFESKQCRANFYKCGDRLPKPHYLSWNKIVNDTPNFHLPEFFGKCAFEK